MNRKEQQLLRQRQTTRQLMGVTRLTEHGAVCGRDELLFYLLRPDNLSILSPEGIRGRVKALTGLLQGMASLELLALDSREAFLKNKQYYQWRLEEEPSPALRELLRQDIEHLNARQSSTAAWISAGDSSSSLSAGSPSGVIRLKVYPFSSAHC